jgi:hypothetical protein
MNELSTGSGALCPAPAGNCKYTDEGLFVWGGMYRAITADYFFGSLSNVKYITETTWIPANNGAISSPMSVGYNLNLILAPPSLFGLGPAFTYTRIPSLNMTCVGAGIGASMGHNFSFGPTVVSTQNAQSILSGWSLSAGYNATPLTGTGGSGNSSGTAGGNSFGIPGASASLTWSKCW